MVLVCPDCLLFQEFLEVQQGSSLNLLIINLNKTNLQSSLWRLNYVHPLHHVREFLVHHQFPVPLEDPPRLEIQEGQQDNHLGKYNLNSRHVFGKKLSNETYCRNCLMKPSTAQWQLLP